MISLSDTQLKIVTDAARRIEPDRCGVFLERVAAMLAMRGRMSRSWPSPAWRISRRLKALSYWLLRRSRTTIQIMVAIISVPPRADASAQ